MAVCRSLVLLLLASVASGCGFRFDGFNTITLTGSGNIVAEEARTSGFRRVAVSSSFNVNVRQGDEFYVLLEADDNVMEFIDVTNDGETLTIGMVPGEHFNFRNVTLMAEVVMPELDALDVSGACQAVITGFESADDIAIDLSAASRLEGDLTAKGVYFDLSGASKATLTGTADRLEVNASGACNAKLGEFHVREAIVDASGASTAIVHATEQLDAEASGASKIRYSGDPTSRRAETSGASSVISE